MPHIDPERLALFAMGEPVATPDETDHLSVCAACVDNLAAFRHVAVAGRASIDIGDLESPPEAVWSRISKELALGSPPALPAPESEEARPEQTSIPDAAPPRRRAMTRVFALAASLVLVAGVGLGVWAINSGSGLTEIAEATLDPFPDHPDAVGAAVVEERSDGTFAVRVKVDAAAAPDTFREVWLITADASALVSLGVMDGSEQTFAVPADVDLRDYVLVDISQEPVDGDPNHSGDSIVRGELTFL